MEIVTLIILSPIILILFWMIGFMLLELLNIIIDTSAKYPKLKFLQFKKFYDINPDRWHLEDTYVMCRLNSGRNEFFSFGLIDFYFKYKPFLKSLEKAEEKEVEAQHYLNMIAAVKKDIADFEERNAKEVDSKINEIWRNAKWLVGMPPAIN